MSPPTEHEKRFAEHLAKLVKDQNLGALAALRRGLGKRPGEAAEAHRYVVPWLPAGARLWQEDAYYLVAALFAWHRGSWPEGDGADRRVTNLGASFARLRDQTESDSTEKRFAALLNCHRDDLPHHLRQAVGLLRSKDVPIDWAQLLRDVIDWDRESRSVQRAWARAFWAQIAAASGEPPATGQEQDHHEER